MPEMFPALPLFIGAILAGITRGKLRALVMLARLPDSSYV